MIGFCYLFNIRCVGEKIHETVTSKNAGNNQHTSVENISEFIHIVNVVLCTKLYKQEQHQLSNNQNQHSHRLCLVFPVGA